MYQGRGGVCQSRRAALLERAPDQALEERLREDGRRLWHTPVAAGLARAAFRCVCGTVSCISLAPAMSVSTIIISARSFAGGRLLTRSGLSAVCSARTSRFPQETARSYAPPATSCRAREGEMLSSMAAFIAARDRGPQLTSSASWTTPPARFPLLSSSHRRCSRVFPPAAPLAAPLRRPPQFLWDKARSLRA